MANVDTNKPRGVKVERLSGAAAKPDARWNAGSAKLLSRPAQFPEANRQLSRPVSNAGARLSVVVLARLTLHGGLMTPVRTTNEVVREAKGIQNRNQGTHTPYQISI